MSPDRVRHGVVAADGDGDASVSRASPTARIAWRLGIRM
jgi:hypothetical protein